jgi:hypothetical protein
MRIPDRLYVWWHRAQNRYWDTRAVLAGFCNHRPWSPIPSEPGGYAHWRCNLRRHHEGLHRSNNYVWSDDGRTDYLPVPVGQRAPHQPWDRHMAGTRRDDRIRDAWLETQYAGILKRKRADARAER